MKIDILMLMTGSDIPAPEIGLTIHQPTMKEIGMIGEKDFILGSQCLLISKKTLLAVDNNLKESLKQANNIDIFLELINNKDVKEQRKQVESVLLVLFPQCKKIFFTPRAIMLSHKDGDVIIDERNFEVFQDYLRIILKLDAAGGDDFNPANEEAARIAAKLKRGRERVAKQKEAQGGSGSIFSIYLSALTIALHIPLDNLINLTIFQINDLVERYQLWLASDIDTKVRLAGGKPDSQPENWMKNIH